MKLIFWLRWAWRDLRLRWLQVLAIALIIALGTGVFAGLGGQMTWRIASYDLSYEMLAMHDLRVSLATGGFVAQDEALAALGEIDGIARVEPRLVLDTLVDASTPDESILVPGRLVGVAVGEGGPHVDRIHVEPGGRGLAADDDRAAVLECKFARYYGLEPGVRLTLIGGHELEVVGLGQSPEYFQIMPADQSGFAAMGEASLAVVFVPLHTAQSLYGRTGLVNELVIRVDEDADQEAVRAAVERHLAAAFPAVGAQVVYGVDDPVRTFVYADAEEDQVMLDLFALIFLLGAALGAFNLAGRLVESQRRQIGIGMALGMPRRWLAVRPLLVGLQIALIGTVLGLGILFSQALGDLTMEVMPLPHWAGTMLHPPSFSQATALGILLPLLATLIPVWRAVRVAPLEAIHGHLTAKSSGLNRWLKGLRLPGNSLAQMPLKNVLRSPHRTLLTVLGIAVAVTLLLIFLGIEDTFLATLDQAAEALLYRSPERVMVSLDSFYPPEHDSVRQLAALRTDDGRPVLRQVQPGLLLGGHLVHGDEQLETMVEFLPAGSTIWTPALREGGLDTAGDLPGIVIAQKAASDLGVSVGDTLLLEHPRREGPFAFSIVSTTLRVTGIHDNPLRGLSYVALDHAAIAGLEGLANVLVAMPGEDVGVEEVRRALFVQPSVAAIQAVAELPEAFEDLMDLLLPILRVMQVAGLFVAFLIAFNSTSINIDDRMREVATLFAFGVRPRTVMWTQVGENLILGALGTALGAALGWVSLDRLLAARMEVMLEDLGLLIIVAPASLIVGAVLGVAVVALTPLATSRKLRRIDIPSTLRVME